MASDIDREFETMSATLVKSLKHFAQKLDDAVSNGTISDEARITIKNNVVEGMSVYMIATGTLLKSGVKSY